MDFFDAIDNFERLEHYRRKFIHSLDLIKKEHPPAETQGKTECCNSGVCCWRRPGNLNEEDVSKIANFFGITEQELFQNYLIVDRIGDSWCLLPARKHQQTGQMINWEETYSIESPCIFLNIENKCDIHEVKPFACREFKCWEKQEVKINNFPKEKLIELGWDGNDPDDNY